MKKQDYIIAVTSVLLLACGGGKKQTLESEVKKEKTGNIEIPSNLVADTVKPQPGIKFKEIRKIDPANPPIVLKLDEPQEKKVFDLADYYSSVKYITLDFPHKEEFHGYNGDASVYATFEKGSLSIGRFSTDIILGNKSIIAGDNLIGYYHYDENGKFLKNIIKPESFPDYNETDNSLSLERDATSSYIVGKAVGIGDMLTFSEVKNKKAYTSYYSISKQGIYYLTYMRFGTAIPISENEMMAFRYNPTRTKQEPIIYSFSIKGDTLCSFANHNPLFNKTIKSVYTNPESVDLFYFGGRLNFRQPYNDTIYSFKSSNEINPRYILSYAKYKPSIETALIGDKAGKYFINSIKETDKFLYITYTSNYDCPNNRKNGSVKFFYSIYDKKDKKLFRIAEGVFPQDFRTENSIKDGIPVNLSNLKTYENKLYLSYTKGQLKRIMDDEHFSKYPSAQQEKIKSLHNGLSEGGLVVVIFE